MLGSEKPPSSMCGRMSQAMMYARTMERMRWAERGGKGEVG